MNLLNDAYAAQIGAKSMRETYQYMIDNYSYRLMTLFTYGKNPTSVRKHLKEPEVPIETDVSMEYI